MLRLLGFTHGFINVVLDLFGDFRAPLVRVRLGGGSFAPHELLGGFLRLCDSLIDLTICLALNLLDLSATMFAHSASAVRKRFGLARGLYCAMLGFTSALSCFARPPGTNLNRIANRRSVNHGRHYLPPFVACAGCSATDGACGLHDARQ
jgi:hypothetical protein